MDLDTLKEKFHKTSEQTWSSAKEMYLKSDILTSDIENNQLQVVIYRNGRELTVDIDDVNRDRISVACSCLNYDSLRLCPHIIASWFELRETELDISQLFPYTEVEMAENIEKLLQIDDLLDQNDFDLAELVDIFVSVLIQPRSDTGQAEYLDEADDLRVINDLLQTTAEADDPVFDQRQSVHTRVDIAQTIFIVYDTGTYIRSQLPELPSSPDKFDAWFDSQDNTTRLLYYLLLSDHNFSRDTFDPVAHKFLRAVDDPDGYKASYDAFLNSKFVQSTAEFVGLTRPVLKRYLVERYDRYLPSLHETDAPPLADLTPQVPKHNGIGLLNAIANILESAKTAFTTKHQLYKSVTKKILDEMPQYLSGEFSRLQSLYIMQWLIQVIIISDLIRVHHDRSVSFTHEYSEFLTKTQEQQQSFLQERLYSFLDDPYSHYTISRYPKAITWGTKYISDYLVKYAVQRDDSGTNSLPGVIYKPAILLDLYKRELELAADGYEEQKKFDFTSWDMLDINDPDLRPQIEIFGFPFQSVYGSLFNLINFCLPIIGAITPLVDDRGRVMAYDLSPRAELQDQQAEVAGGQDIYIMPDYSLKGSRTTFTTDQLNWLLEFTEVDKLDNLIETKLTKEKYWQFLERYDAGKQRYIERLSDMAVNDIPDNILTSIDEWTDQFGFVQVISDGVTIEISEPELIDNMTQLKTMEDVKFIRLAPTVVVIPEGSATKVTGYLKRRGYHVNTIAL